MIYLTIPEGMVFKKKVNEKDTLKKETIDCFVDPNGIKASIELQYLVKEALRTNTARKNCIKLNEFAIYLRTPPDSGEPFLAYTPKHNGKLPTDIEPKLVIGSTMQKFDPKKYSRYGTFWHQYANLSSQKIGLIETKMQEQKDNRRHIGDFPLAT